MKPLSDKTAGFTDSVIRRMTRVSNQYGAINLSQGFPDFDPPKEITDKLSELAHIGPHQYATTWGSQTIREALARKQKHFSGMDLSLIHISQTRQSISPKRQEYHAEKSQG